MNIAGSDPGQIVTFYSYKGGAGRSMALANVACLLGRRLAGESRGGQRSPKLLVIDWDIEAPGLHRFFADKAELPAYRDTPGIIDYFWKLTSGLRKGNYKKICDDEGWGEFNRMFPLDGYIIPDVEPGVDFIPAGRFDPEYPEKVTSFDWVLFYERYRLAFRKLREYISGIYPWCFIDSRTGLSDVSGVCTMLMPEKLVTVFTPSRQSLEGVLDLIRKAVDYRTKSSDDHRPLAVFPLLSRLVLDEEVLTSEARDESRRKFEDCFREAYGLEECDLSPYFDNVEVPHRGFYGFKERVAVRDDIAKTHALAINRAYERFYERLYAQNHAWESFKEATQRVWEREMKPRWVPADPEARQQVQSNYDGVFAREEGRLDALLYVQTIDKDGLSKAFTVPASGVRPECGLLVEPLPGTSMAQVLLKVGSSAVRAEIEADGNGRIPLNVVWNEQRILRLTSEAGAVLTLPPDERYAPAPPLRRAQDSQKLDLVFLIDGTTKALSTTEPPAFIPLLDESRSKGWTAFVEKLVLLTAELGKSYGDMRTGVLAFGDHSMKFISSSPDLTCRYLIYPEDSEERKLYSRTQDQLRQQLMQIPHTSGGDFVDALGEALQQCKEAGWGADARKMIVLCGDSPGFSLFKPAPAGADIHLRQIDVDQAATELHAQHGVEIASIYLGVPASKTKNPYNVSEPKAFLDHVRSQYRRLASLPGLAWDDSSFDPKAAAKAIQAVPPLIARGSCYGMVSLENASRESRSEVEQGAGRFSI